MLTESRELAAWLKELLHHAEVRHVDLCGVSTKRWVAPTRFYVPSSAGDGKLLRIDTETLFELIHDFLTHGGVDGCSDG